MKTRVLIGMIVGFSLLCSQVVVAVAPTVAEMAGKQLMESGLSITIKD
jgi:hypothetical protein